jgi:prolipoprotein diacylglyceryltransferase
MALLMVTYPILRFLNECLRADEGAVVAGLTAAQAISVVLLLAGVLTWCYLARLPRMRHADTVRGSGPAPSRPHAATGNRAINAH